jgi:hypothetical protein
MAMTQARAKAENARAADDSSIIFRSDWALHDGRDSPATESQTKRLKARGAVVDLDMQNLTPIYSQRPQKT